MEQEQAIRSSWKSHPKIFLHLFEIFEDLTLGLRLDVDYDGFWRRSDALEQLELWRKAIASRVLGLPSQHLHLQRIRSS